MMTTRGVLVGVLIACFAAFALTGCGGGNSDETEPQTLTKPQYVKKADMICARANDRQEDLLQKEAESLTGAPSDSDRVALVKNAGLPPLQDAAADLDELGAPSGEEKNAEALVEALQEALKKIEANPLTFAEGRSNAYAPVEEAAKRLGLKVCGLP